MNYKPGCGVVAVMMAAYAAAGRGRAGDPREPRGPSSRLHGAFAFPSGPRSQPSGRR